MSAVAPPVVDREAVARRVAADDTACRDGARPEVRRAVARALAEQGVVLPPAEWAHLVRELVDELVGLGPLEGLLRDPSVTDVVCNGPGDVRVDRGGRMVGTDTTFRDDDHLLRTMRRALAPLGVRLDHLRPWADGVLPNGVRVHAIVPPLADAPCLTLRRVPTTVPTWDDLVARRGCTSDQAVLLRGLVERRQNVVVAGGAGTGKTTLLRRLLDDVVDDRVVVIEDTPELRLRHHAVALRTRHPSADGVGGVATEVLVRNALRMRPDRLVVGEVRGAEVADMLQACNTGHAGSMCTVHANGAADACVRLHGMALLAGVAEAAARAQVAAAVDVVVVMARAQDGRRHVADVAVLDGWSPRGWSLRPLSADEAPVEAVPAEAVPAEAVPAEAVPAEQAPADAVERDRG